jgi:hypothetical protein
MIQTFHDAFAPLLGLPAWSVKRGHGSFVTLEFGNPRLDVREPDRSLRIVESPRTERILRRRRVTPVGDWHLWIYLSAWELRQGGETIATWDFDVDSVDAALSELDGQVLKTFDLRPSPFETVFDFDLGGQLVVRPYESASLDPEELWLLYEPSGEVLTLRSDATFCHHPSDFKGDDRWISVW